MDKKFASGEGKKSKFQEKKILAANLKTKKAQLRWSLEMPLDETSWERNIFAKVQAALKKTLLHEVL